MTVLARPADERSVGRALRATRVIHPFPVALNVGATLGLAVIARDGTAGASELARLASAMFCAQAAIGASNDYCDRELDARTKPYKPIVRGYLEPRTALAIAAASALLAGALTATFGLLSFSIAAMGLGAGAAYNVRLKRSVLSALPFMIALPALAFWVWVSLDRFSADLWWLIPFAPLAGLAVHLSNTLPDIESDRAAGVRGLAHTIGPAASRRVAWGSFASALLLALFLGLFLDYDWRFFAPGAIAALLLLATSIAAHRLYPGEAALQIGFGLISVATAFLAAAWLAAIG